MTLVLPWVILLIPEVRFRQRLFAPTPRPRAFGRGVLICLWAPAQHLATFLRPSR